MTTPAKSAIWLTVAVLASLFFGAGCGMNRRYANNAIRELPHSEVAIEYRSAGPKNSAVAQDELASSASTTQVLTITYPHPSPKYGRKYAEVVLRDQGNATDEAKTTAVTQLVTNPFKKQEALATGDGDGEHALRLTIPREEVEFLLRDLVADSYFDREDRNGGINLRVTLGARTTNKAWDHVASFDQLARRVTEENEKRLGSHPRGSKVMPASAELLPPNSDELTEGSNSESKRRARLHSVPEF